MSAKKLILIAIALIAGVSAYSQEFNFGVKGGVTANWLPGTYTDVGDKAVTNIGYYGGLALRCGFSGPVFAQLEALYARKGIRTTNPILGKYSRNISYIEVPLLAGLTFQNDRLRLLLGPEFGFCTGNKIKADNINLSSIGKPRPFDLCIVIQPSVGITDNLAVDLKFDVGLLRVFENASIGDTRDRGRNSSVMLGVSYFFGD